MGLRAREIEREVETTKRWEKGKKRERERVGVGFASRCVLRIKFYNSK